MWIYIAHTRSTSNALNTVILVEVCLECPPEADISAPICLMSMRNLQNNRSLQKEDFSTCVALQLSAASRQ